MVSCGISVFLTVIIFIVYADMQKHIFIINKRKDVVTMKKKLLAAAVAACLALTTMLPAWAADAEGVTTEQELKDALAAGGTVTLGADISLTGTLQITTDVTINGNGKTITAADNFAAGSEAWGKDLVLINSADVSLTNVTLQVKAGNKNVLNTFCSDVTLTDVTLDHAAAETGAPMIVNGSDVTVNGGFNLVMDADSWYGVNVDKSASVSADRTESKIQFAEDAVVTQTGVPMNNELIFIDEADRETTGITIDSENGGLLTSEDGKIAYASTVVVKTAADLEAIATKGVAGQTIELGNDITLDKGIIISADNITIDGKDHRITAGENFANNDQGQPQLVKIYDAENVTLKNALLQATDKTKHVLDVHTSKGIVLENLTLNHEEAFDGAPLIINYTDVTVKGTLGLITGENSWYGINLDNKSGAASIEFAEGSSVTMTDNSGEDLDVIKIDMGDEDAPAPEVKNPENAGLVANEDGTYREEVKVTGVTLDASKKDLKVGESFTLKATIAPDSADDKTLTWTSSDDKVATVDASGKVTAVAAGTATITVKAGDATATCDVTVTAATVTDPDKDNDSDNVQNPDKEENGDTGVADYMMLFAVLAIVSAGAVVFTVKKAAKR